MEVPYELLIKYCRKQATPDESMQVEQWLTEGENLSLFLDLKKEWTHIDDASTVTPDKHLVWNKIQNNILSENKSGNRLIKIFRVTAIAAAIIALIAVSGIFYVYNNNKPIEQQTTQYTSITTRGNEKSKIELADGSMVWLNSNSLLSFNNHFNKNNREITANGELFFDVTPSDKKFIVNAGEIKIEVLGTSFNLKTGADRQDIEISLKKGKIAVINQKNNKQLFIMDSSQHAVINKQNLSHIIKTENVSLSNIWLEESLPMYNESLNNIFSKLENWYGVKIDYSGLDTSKRYTFNIQKESLSEFLELFSAITPINYTIIDKKVRINADIE